MVWRYGNSELTLHDGMWRMTLREGTRYEAGFAYGRLLAEADHPSVRILKRYLVRIAISFLNRIVRKHFSDIRIPAEYLDELRGYADGSGIAYAHLFFINFVFDVLPKYGYHCSTVAWTETDPVLIARNTDLFPAFTRMALRHAPALVVEHALPNTHTFTHVGPPFSIGAISGINARGIAIASHQIGGVPEPWIKDSLATPLLMRIVLEQADTLERGSEIIKHDRPFRPLNLLLASKNERQTCVLEVHPERLSEHPRQVFAACTTHFRSKLLKKLHFKHAEESSDRLILLERIAAAHAKTHTTEDAIALLKNTDNGLVHIFSGRSPTNWGTYQSFVIDCTNNAIHISNGARPPVSLSGSYITVPLFS